MTFALRQSAAYWAPSGIDGYGQATYAAPVLVSCRWETRQELYINEAGESLTSANVVYSASELAIDGKMLLVGSLSGLTTTPPASARRIEAAAISPSVKNDSNLFKQWLR
jgi:hypothetical protein